MDDIRTWRMTDNIGQKSWAITAMAGRKSSCHIFHNPLKVSPILSVATFSGDYISL